MATRESADMRDEERLKRQNRAVAAGAIGIVVAMLGLVAISPILYRTYVVYMGGTGRPALQASVRIGEHAPAD